MELEDVVQSGWPCMLLWSPHLQWYPTMRINRHWKLITSTLLASAMLTACGGDESNKQASLDTAAESPAGTAAPVARIENTTDTHWGVEVDDPYRYMEDQDDPEVVDWFKGQAEYTESVLAGLPMREELYERLIENPRGRRRATLLAGRLHAVMGRQLRNLWSRSGRIGTHVVPYDGSFFRQRRGFAYR